MSTEWMPRAEWDRMVAGDNDLVRYANAPYETVAITEYGYTVADLERSRLQLSRNQYVRGYCILVAKKAAKEPFEMYPHERALFFEDMIAAAQAIQTVFEPIKLNYMMLGNAIPHLHVHIVPRYYGDPAPSKPIAPNAETVTLPADADYLQLVGDLREALGYIRERVNIPLLAHVLDKQGRITDWPTRKQTDTQMAIREYLFSKFEPDKRYTEKEVNALLNQWATFGDWALLRRELVMNGFLNREKNGSSYWVEDVEAVGS